jgi:hypothetical protein
VDLDRPVLPRRHHPRNVIALCRDNDIPVFEKVFSLTDVYGATSIRHRHVRRRRAGATRSRPPHQRIRNAARGRWSNACQGLYRNLVARDVAARSASNRSAMTLRIAMWSGPAQHLHRDDARPGRTAATARSDEPLYAHYLAHTGSTIPGATR